MATALIISVGGSPEPIIFSIRERAPDGVCFFASQQSIDLVGKIKDAVARPLNDYKVMVEDAEDLTRCYERALECFDWAEQALPGCDKIADVTGGTKAMSSALAVAAVARGAAFSYVGGTSRDRGGLGVVETGSERIVESVNPWTLFAVEERRIIARYFDTYQYAAAAEAIAAVLPRMRTSDAALLEPIGDAARAYMEWERFNHRDAVEALKAADRKLRERLPLVPGQAHGPLAGFHQQLARSLANLQRLNNKTRGFQALHPLMAADLAANAARRIEEARYDDATARLYRALEMIGQCAFEARFGGSTGNAPADKLPASIREEYEKNYRAADGKIELPLFATFRALAEAGAEIGRRLHEDAEVRKLLSGRNNSMLAHGVQPVSRHAAQSFMKIVTGYLPEQTEFVEFPRLSL
jgi:CRISPR-associated protein (TIGR02710 family)